ncbi:multidrug efflux protein [Pseudomonas aeruginosa]|nr:multidrug efflux protein [Pseudomonas aeruginosa]
MIMVMQPEGTPMAETMANVGDVERYLAEHEPVAYAYAVGGFSLYGDGTSSAMIFATLKDWSERREASQHVGAISSSALTSASPACPTVRCMR